MEAAQAPIEDRSERLREVALLLMAWQDVPVKGSRVRGESGSGEPATVTGRTSSRRRDELLLRLDQEDRDESGSVVELASFRQEHPAFAALAAAMARLAQVNHAAHRTLRGRLVGRSAGLVEAHMLAETQMGDQAVRSALASLDRLLPVGLRFPRFVYAQIEGWTRWLADLRAVASKPVSAAERRLLARAYADAGLTQRQIADRLGVSQQAVSKMLAYEDVTEAVAFPNTSPEKRAASRAMVAGDLRRHDATPEHLRLTVPELQAKWRQMRGL